MNSQPTDFTSEKPASKCVLGLEHVTKVFGGTVALKDVSLDLRAGEVLALLGENGAGKSTCVKLLTGLYRPDEGQIVLDGAPVALASPLTDFAAAFRWSISIRDCSMILALPKTFLSVTCRPTKSAG